MGLKKYPRARFAIPIDQRQRCSPRNPGPNLATELAFPALRGFLVQILLESHKHLGDLLRYAEILNCV